MYDRIANETPFFFSLLITQLYRESLTSKKKNHICAGKALFGLQFKNKSGKTGPLCLYRLLITYVVYQHSPKDISQWTGSGYSSSTWW